MEYLERGDLHSYLRRPFPEAEAIAITHQLLEGLRFMHEAGFAHRDLKPRVRSQAVCFLVFPASSLTRSSMQNILVHISRPNWWVKIADFGISKRIHESTGLRTAIGTEGYIAPEVLGIFPKGDREDLSGLYTLAVDIWAVGMIAWRMVTNRPAFSTQGDLVSYVFKEKPLSSISTTALSTECNDFLERTLAISACLRPSSKEALQHPWIQLYEEQNTAVEHEAEPESDESSVQTTGPSAVWSIDSQTMPAPASDPRGVERKDTTALRLRNKGKGNATETSHVQEEHQGTRDTYPRTVGNRGKPLVKKAGETLEELDRKERRNSRDLGRGDDRSWLMEPNPLHRRPLYRDREVLIEPNHRTQRPVRDTHSGSLPLRPPPSGPEIYYNDHPIRPTSTRPSRPKAYPMAYVKIYDEDGNSTTLPRYPSSSTSPSKEDNLEVDSEPILPRALSPSALAVRLGERRAQARAEKRHDKRTSREGSFSRRVYLLNQSRGGEGSAQERREDDTDSKDSLVYEPVRGQRNREEPESENPDESPPSQHRNVRISVEPPFVKAGGKNPEDEEEYREGLERIASDEMARWRRPDLVQEEGLFRQVLWGKKEVLGEERPDPLTPFHRFAEDLYRAGMYDRASQMYQYALDVREKVLGEEHPDTLRNLCCLAWVLEKQRMRDGSSPMYRQVLKVRERLLGEDHPVTLNAAISSANELVMRAPGSSTTV